MVITAAQTTDFFSEPGQIALPAATRIVIAQEGLEDLADLVEFDERSPKTDHGQPPSPRRMRP